MDSTDAVQRLERDLRKICGPRLRSLLTYGAHAPTPAHGNGHHSDDEHATAIRSMVVVDSLSLVDLRACAALTPAWHDSGLATPLIVTTHELERSLDVFPLEFDSIRSRHSLVAGSDPFASLGVDVADIRRACEVQARSHLLHLREGCLETGGRADAAQASAGVTPVTSRRGSTASVTLTFSASEVPVFSTSIVRPRSKRSMSWNSRSEPSTAAAVWGPRATHSPWSRISRPSAAAASWSAPATSDRGRRFARRWACRPISAR
jgi:hypothetical protein